MVFLFIRCHKADGEVVLVKGLTRVPNEITVAEACRDVVADKVGISGEAWAAYDVFLTPSQESTTPDQGPLDTSSLLASYKIKNGAALFVKPKGDATAACAPPADSVPAPSASTIAAIAVAVSSPRAPAVADHEEEVEEEDEGDEAEEQEAKVSPKLPKAGCSSITSRDAGGSESEAAESALEEESDRSISDDDEAVSPPPPPTQTGGKAAAQDPKSNPFPNHFPNHSNSISNCKSLS
eukprot:m51a1_g3748 hypothetical protein (238) ;mRNA; r:71363-72311